MRRLDEKAAVVTGAAGGIGEATALLFAEHGARVVVADINEAGGDGVVSRIRADGGEAWFVKTDVSSAAEVEALMAEARAHLGRLDILVCNAGLQYSGALAEFPESKWEDLMSVNATSCFLCAKYSVPYLIESGGGSIVNMASSAGIKGGPGMTAYSASKGAVIAFTRAAAAELAPYNIRVNCIAPGWVDTPFNEPAISYMGGSQKQFEMVTQSVPLARQAVPEEIAQGYLYLCDETSASYVTGQVLTIDGGML